MKIALIAGGQPRFTPDFVTFMNQLTGFDQADFYFNFWNSDWANSEEEARAKIEKVLLPNYNLAKVQLADQPPFVLPDHDIDLPPAQPENVLWWYERRIGMWQSIQMAYNLIDQDYDLVIKFRLDGRLEQPLDVSQLDFTQTDLLMPGINQAGFDNNRVCDLFAVGTPAGMKFYCDIADHIFDLVPQSDPLWFNRYNGPWSSEHLFGIYLQQNNRTQSFGDFKFHINTGGRSRYTDHHFHHGIVQDPTEL
jgi:hypothetical protein